MDFHFLYDGQVFVWDTEKAASNLTKHGIAFELACMVFFDPFFLTEDASVDEEKREAAIGYAEPWRLFYVVHVVREGNLIRIISAREATPKERSLYEGNE